MNKIYKVIWSKVKHQYVVTSEFAHSCTKSTTSRAGRSAAAVLAALILTTGICAVPAQAADPTLEELYYEQLNSTVHNDETSSPVVKLVEAPTAAPTAAKDGEQAVDNDMQTGEDGGMTGAADQYTVVNEDGFYASNTKGTHNTLSKDGLWVGGTDDNTGFHVDNDGNVRTTGRVTATTVTGGTVIGETIQNANGSFSVDANGNVDTETVKSEGMSVVDEDGNTTFQVLSNGDVTAHDVTANTVDANAVTATTVTGGTVIGETIQNANGSFSVDANGNVDAETVKSEGMSVVDEDGNTTFQVLSNGDVTAHAVTATTVTGGTIQNADGSFSVDANGNVDAETVKSEGMSVVDEDGNTTFQVLANGDVTAHDVIANSYSNVNGTFVADENGKVTAEKGDIGDVKLADGKVTAKKGDIGDVWLSEGTISHVQNITAESGTIGNVELDDGKVTADKGDIGDVWLSEGNISNVQNIKAESGNIGDVKLADGKVTAQKADIGRVFIKNESIQAGNIKINENGSNEITGLSNTRWNDGTPVDEDRAATEGQLSTVQGYVDDLEAKTQHITHTENADGTHYTTVEEANFYSDGRMDAANGKFRVNEKGGVNVNDGAFQIYSSGGVQAAHGKFRVKDETGEVTVEESLSVGKHDDETYAFTVDKAGNTEVDGTMVIQGKTIINANADIKGSLEAAGNKFKVDGNTGEVTAPKGNIGGVILETTDDGKSKVKADKADIGGVIIKDKGIEAGTVQINKGSATDNRVLDVNGNFAVYNDGAFKAAGENFVVKATGDVTANSYRNANGTFTADETGLVTATKAQIDNVTIGGEDPSAAIKVSDDNFIVYNDGAFQAAGRKFLVNNQGEMTAAAATVDNVVIDNNQVTGLSNTTWNPEDPDSIVEDRAATEGQLEDFQSQVDETIGTGDFSRTNYARGAENVTEAIYDVDAQVKVNSDALDAYEAAGIVAGNEVGQYSNAIALGNNATADGWSAVAIGSNAEAEGSNSVAIGVDSASGALSTAVGAGSTADGTQATALGQNSNALGQGTVSLGANTKADGEGAVSIGFNNSAEAAGSVAIGNGAHVYESGTNSVALGQWSTTSDDKVVSVGNDWLKRRITNVAAGTAVTDAVNKGQLDDAVDGVVKWDSDGDGGYETGHLTSVTEFEANNQVGESITLNEKDGLILRSSGAQGNSTISMNDGTLSLRNGNAENTTFVDVTTNGTTFSQLTDNSKTTISGGNIVTDSVTGLDNTEWNGTTNNESRAATEGQLADLNEVVEDNAKGVVKWDNLDEEAGQIKGVTFAGYGNLEVSDLKFDTLSNKEDTFSVDADGSVSALNGQFVVNEDGMTVTGEDGGSFAINAAGEIAAATAADAASGYVYSFNMNNTEGITLGAEEATMTINDRGATFRGDTTDATTNINADEITTGTVLANSNMYIGTVDDGNAVVTQDQLTDTVGNATDGMVTWDQDPVDHTYQEGSLSSVTNLNVTGNATLQNSNNIFDSEYIALSDNPESRQLQLGSYVTGANDDITLGQITLENGTINMSAGSLSEPSNITEIYVNSDGLTVSTLGNDELGGTDKTTIDGGRITTGTINAANGNFVVYSDGSVESKSKIGAINGEFSNLLHATVGRFDTLQVGARTDDKFAFYVASDGSVDAAKGAFRVYSDGGVKTPWVTGLSNTTWTPDTVHYEKSANAATEAQLAVVDSKAQGNTNVLAEYEDAGIIAGSVDGEAEGAIAIGEGAAAINGNSIPNGAIAIGHEATVSMNGAVAIGDGANAVGQNSVALGTGASTTNGGWNSVAIGWGSQATDSNVVSVGSDEYKRRIVNVADGVNDNDAVNVGQLQAVDTKVNANAAAINKLKIAGQALKETSAQVANFAAQTQGINWDNLNALSQIAPMSLDVPMMTNSVLSASQEAKEVTRDPVYGTGSDGAALIDTNLTVTGDTHLKGDLEVDGKATFNNGVEITKGNLEMNNNKITGVANGDISETSKDAVNGSQLYGVQQKVEANTQNINTLGGAVNKLGNRIERVGAGAAALAALHPLDFDPDNKLDFAAGFGNYRGASAVAVGAFYRPSENVMFSVGGAFGGGEDMVNAGVSFKVGAGSGSATTSRTAMAKSLKSMQEVVASQDAQLAQQREQIDKLTAMVELLMEQNGQAQPKDGDAQAAQPQQ